MNDDARTPAARFAGEEPGMTYGRTQNPTTQMLEERIAMMEGAEACRAADESAPPVATNVIERG